LAADAGCTPAQLALAWILHKAPHAIPIPGTQSMEHMQENAAAEAVAVSAEVMAKLETLINQNTVTGPRYDPASEQDVDTERF
jgi:aryl-alcohol dehydrogenase-like predicted oxidoreductase